MLRKNNSIPLVLLIILAFLCGPTAFLGGLAALWMNEGRVNWGEVAAAALPINAEQIAPAAANEGKFVAVTGFAKIAEAYWVGDAPYLKPGAYLKLERVAEMYAWHEKKTYGGARNSTPTVTYSGEWTSTPPKWREFVEAQTHANPDPAISVATFAPAQAEMGAYVFYPDREMTFQTGLTLTLSHAIIGNGLSMMSDNAIYAGQGAAANPKIGDMRVKYRAVLPINRPVTVFGKQTANAIEPYLHRGKSRLYRLVPGNRDEAIAALRQEYTTTLWGTRFFGVISTWFGLFFLLLPFSKLTNIFARVPLFKLIRHVSWVVVGAIALVLAFPLSLIVILIANLF